VARRDERYPIGAQVRGRVLSVTDYGAFVELEQGIEGLVHVSEMTWSKRMKHPSKMVKPGDEVETIILSVNPNDRRISLGMKQLQDNPWEQLSSKYPTGAIIEGRVRNLTDFGAFIEIEDGIDGLVHVSNLSWTKRIKHPSEVLKKGEKVKASFSASSRRTAASRSASSSFSPMSGRRSSPSTALATSSRARFCAPRSSAPSLRSPKESRASATSPKQSTPRQAGQAGSWLRSTSSRSSR
jgi:predicted RNA-binding protein with RPS1 domain